MGNSTLLKCRGLYSFANKLSEMPEGALTKALNIVVNRDSIIEPRRGFKLYGDAMGSSPSQDISKQLLVYKGRILRHFQTTLEYDSDGAGVFSAFTGAFSETESGLRIKGLEVNSNFYFTSNSGIKKISVTDASFFSSATVSSAGGIRALDLELTLNSEAGFFTQDSSVAYRVVWGIKDANNNLILGFPSERAVITNPITDLLITDFNNLLTALDGQALSGGINDGNYLTSLKVTANSPASTLYNNLTALATKIDNDTVITEGAIDTASASLTSNVASLVFNSSVATFLEIGDQITISGLSGAVVDLNGTHTLTNVSTTTVQFNFTHANIASTPDTGGVVKRLKYTLLTAPTALSATPTTAQLESMQTYYDSIVTELQAEPAGIALDSDFDLLVSTQSATVNLRFTVPQGITTTYFYQIYRTAMDTSTGATTISDLEPGDEQALVFEANPTSAEISTGYIELQDITPESFRGANLYTNPNSGEGILQGNAAPPKAKDIALYKNFTFYANTETRHQKNFSILSVDDLTTGVATFTITDGTTTNTYTFVDPAAQIITVTCVAGSAYASSGAADYFDLYSAEDTTHYRVWFNRGTATAPSSTGVTLVEIAVAGTESANDIADEVYAALNEFGDFSISNPAANIITITNSTKGIASDPTENVTDAGFTVAVTAQGAGEDAANKKILISELETPAQQVDETARSLQRVINANASELVYCYYLSGPDDVPGNMLLETRGIGGSAFYLNVNSTLTGGEFSPALPVSGNSEISSNEVSLNRIYHSKNQQPEAVPIVNYLDVGPKDKRILRIVALRDSLFILKEEGIYRLSGESAPFFVALFDSSTNLKAPDSAAVLNNQIYIASDQGVATISDTGVSIVSRQIEDLLVKFTSRANFATATFGVTYESDRSYYLYTIKANSDTVATRCFRYNTFTSTWTEYDQSKTCGIVNPQDDKMYLGASDTNFIEQERKDFSRTDHADREISINVAPDSVIGTVIALGNVASFDVGDVLVQSQTVTIAQYQRLLRKLDGDTGLENDYVSSLTVAAGVQMSDALDDLITKIANDANRLATAGATSAGSYTALLPTPTTFTGMQTTFNSLRTLLNADVAVNYSNYFASSGTVSQEVLITGVNSSTNKVTTQYAYPFIAGDALIYKSFESEVNWAPRNMEDPSIMKHAREGTFLFEDSSFSGATASYSSDLSPEFKEIAFSGSGNGAFGGTTYGTTAFGGDGSGVPFRTYIPREKQRCRYLICGFKHTAAREKFAIYGLSLVYEPISPRAYKGLNNG